MLEETPERNTSKETTSIMAQRPKRKPDPNKTKHAQKSKPAQPESAALKPTSDTSGTPGQDVKPPKPRAVAGDSGLRARRLVEATYGLTEAGIIHSAGESSLLQDRIIQHLKHYHPIRRTTAQIACELGVAEQIVISILQNLSRTSEAPEPTEIARSATEAGDYKAEADLDLLWSGSRPAYTAAVAATEQETSPVGRLYGLTRAGCTAARNDAFDDLRPHPDAISVVKVLLAPSSQPCSRRLTADQIAEDPIAKELGLSYDRVGLAIGPLLGHHWIS